jgi:sugar lactone lactonase YvrE/aminoglycoside phosphotransferase (APT) family kinase protein
MIEERWKRVKELLHRAMQLAPEQRGPFLDQACSGDGALRAEVESLLLAEDEVRPSFLQTPPPARPGNGADMPQPIPGLPGRLGPYEILAPIAKGGMGEVYRARDTRLGRCVAVKILPAEMCHDPDRLARFEHEARAASALNHPNIVSVFDIGREGGIPFIVTEFIEGESLRRLVARGPVPAVPLIAIATQLATGLRAAHAAGVVHRDLKPENIMLTPDTQVKILDFGLAKHTPQRLDSAAGMETEVMTAPGLVLGTVGYLSPEQVRGEAVDARSDIFSLGAVLYELAAGKRPYTGGKAIEVLSAILREEPAELRADIPPALERIILRCLKKDPQQRFQNAASVAAALKSIGEISGMRRVLWSIERHRRAWWTAVGVAAVLLAACGVWLGPRWQNRTAPASPLLQAAAQSTVAASLHRVPKETAPATPAPAPAPAATDPKPVAQPTVAEAIPHAKEAAPPAPTPEPPKIEPPAVVRTAVIEALAGRPWKFSGDGMPARQVALGHFDDIKCDRDGNIYAADWGSQAIVKIDRSGILHVLAGPDSPPDDRPRYPHFLAMDALRAIYFSQVFVIRKLLPNGHILPFAGKYTSGTTPDGLRAQGSAITGVAGMAVGVDGSLIFSEFGNRRVRRVDMQGNLQTVAGNGMEGFSGDGGPAERASLSGPRGLALDRAGNLYIADSLNHCVRRVSPYRQITTVAGHGVGGKLGCPSGLALNERDDLFIADPCRGQVLVVRGARISVAGGRGVIHEEPSGDGGPASAALFDEWALALDERGNVLISGPDFGHIYRISLDGTFRIIAGSGLWGATRDGIPANQAMFQEPLSVAVDGAGNVFLTDMTANCIYRVDRKGTVTHLAGYPGLSHAGFEGEDTAARYYRLNGPHGMRVRPDGSVVFADRDNNRIRQVTTDGRLRTLAGNGNRAYGGDGGRALEAELNLPSGVCLDNAGNIFIADTDNHRVRRIAPDGKIYTVAGNGTAGFSGDGGPAERAALNSPAAVETDSAGNLYIADIQNHRVRRVAGGVITTLAGDGHTGYSGDGGPATGARLDLPADLALGGDRQLFVLDKLNHRIRKIDLASGTISTFAGNGESTSSGDGGPATKAGLGRPAGIAADAAGNVYVTDLESRQLRVIRRDSN